LELVVDANALFSALIKNSHTRHFLLLGSYSFFVPEFVFEEIREHLDELAEKSGVSKQELDAVLSGIITSANILIIPFCEFRQYAKKARWISPDADDVHYFALALKLGCGIWSNDKRLLGQKEVRIYSTKEVLSGLF